MILAGMILEGAALLAFRGFTGRGPKAIVANLMSGGCLLLAWRVSESGGSIIAVCALLAAALVAHGLDLAQRWRAPAPTPQISSATVSVRAGPKRTR
jgi:hypothetical protein